MITTYFNTILRSQFSRAVDATKKHVLRDSRWVNTLLTNNGNVGALGMSATLAIGAGIVAAGVVSAYVRRGCLDDQRVVQLLDGESGWDQLPGDLIYNEFANDQVVAIATPVDEQLGLDPTHPVEGGRNVPYEIATSGNPVVNGMELEMTPFKVNTHKRIRNRVKYSHLVIAECKIKFGIPKDNAANRAAVRRHASKLMQQHGVRPAHVRRELPQIIESTFMPDSWELKAARLRLSSEALNRIWQFNCYKAAAIALGAEASNA